MKKVALIHTVKGVLSTFDEQLRTAMPGMSLKIYNTYDDFLALDADPKESGTFTIKNSQRLYHIVQAAALTMADIIVVTCSTLSAAVAQIRPFISIPLVAIDDAMIEAVVNKGDRIKILATAKSTVEPTCHRMYAEAGKQNKIIHLDVAVNEKAFIAMRSGRMDDHDALLKSGITGLCGYDAIVLAQASMAHLEREIEGITGIPTFSSPRYCIDSIKAILMG